MSTVPQALVTAEMLEGMPDNARRELVRGVLSEMSPVGKGHGGVVMKLGSRLVQWSEAGSHGYIGTEEGFILARDPDIVRAPDILFIRADRIDPTDNSSGYWTIAPDLVVEVVSPSESATDVNEKVQDYLAAGTPLMWIVYPRTRQVVAYLPGNQVKIFTQDDMLEHPDVLPGFRCSVAELFE